MAENNEQTPETASSPASRKLLLGIAVGFFSSVAGGAGGYFVLGPELIKHKARATIEAAACPAPEKAAEGGDAAKGGHGEADASQGAQIFEVANLIVNPAQTRGSRHLLVSVGMEVASAAEAAVLKERELYVRDLLLNHLGGKTVDVLTLPEGKEVLRMEIAKMLTDSLPEVKVTRVLFSQFILQ